MMLLTINTSFLGLLLGFCLFFAGLILLLQRNHMVLMLLGVELMFNAANIHLAIFGALHGTTEHQSFIVFNIAIAACESAVGLAIILEVFRHFKTLEPDQVASLKN